MGKNLGQKKKFDYDCIIVGAGPAGLTAAVYLRRFKRTCLLVGAGKPRASWIPNTHNLIGYSVGISGLELLKRMTKQAAKVHTPFIKGEGNLFRIQKGFKLKVGKKTFYSPTAIIATGFTDIQPRIKNVVELRKAGLLRYCPVCDAYEHRDKVLAVLIKDLEGLERALFLKRFTSKLIVLAVEGFSLSAIAKHKFDEQGIDYREADLISISASRSPSKQLKVKLNTGERIQVDGVYVELGCEVNSSAFKHLKKLRKSKSGFLIATSEQKLSIPGLYAAGDCVNNLGQLSVAAGQGAIAATSIHNELP